MAGVGLRVLFDDRFANEVKDAFEITKKAEK
jgi:hypothetical protein